MPESQAGLLTPAHTPAKSVRQSQKAFLSALSQCGTYHKAATLIGIEPHTVSRWIQKYPKFAELATEIKEHALKTLILDNIESNFADRAVAGKEDGQSAIIGMFMAKRADPRYRDNAQVNVAVTGPVAIQFNLSQAPTEAKRLEQTDTEAE